MLEVFGTFNLVFFIGSLYRHANSTVTRCPRFRPIGAVGIAIDQFHEAWVVYKAAPFLLRAYPEYRIHLWRSLAAFALRTGHDYWAWRFAGWGLHYVQDLTQPYHARVLPGVGVTRMLWINTLDLVGIHRPRQAAVQWH